MYIRSHNNLIRTRRYSLPEIDHEMKKKLDRGIRAEDEVEKEGRSLSKLKEYISNRRD